jgi:phosphoserine phosphatase RsbU/P
MSNLKPQLACFELWGGNGSANHAVELPGLSGWVYSAPLETGTGGGDVHYFSVCSKGMVSRIAVADVAGHGNKANSVAENLRRTLQRHTNSWDQSTLMQELNDAFVGETSVGRYATAVVLGFYLETSELLFSSAGHPPVLWYRANEKSWELLQEFTPFSVEIADLPLGLIPGTTYHQTAVRLMPEDMLLLYTDGITEAIDHLGNQLGHDGLLKLVRSVTPDSPPEMCRSVMRRIEGHRGSLSRRDDETLVLFQRPKLEQA